MKAWRYSIAACLLFTLLLLAGCGGPGADVTVFIMPSNGIPNEATTKLKEELQARIGETMSVDVLGSIIYSIEKLIAEVAAGGHGVFVLPEQQVQTFANNGDSFVNLEPYFEKEQYPSGVLEVVDRNKETEIRKKHLYAIPLEGTKWIQAIQYKGTSLYAFVPVNAPDADKAITVLKVMTEKA